MKISEKLNNKKILIWGYGREGKATHEFINKFCTGTQVSVFEGARSDIDESLYDLIIKSPGISAFDLSGKFTSQTELFLEEFADRTIGITGTKGKSTTSSLLYTVLSSCLDRKVLFMGNIGLPCLNYYEEIDDDTVIVFEMSCHQLASVSVSPHIAVFLNLYEDHLDYYGTMEKYFSAKQNITRFQSASDVFICGKQVPSFPTSARKIIISYDDERSFDMKLKGEHNQYNARFVYYICRELFGCDDASIRSVIREFGGLPHRMEFVGNVNGIDFYNDSISTIPEATIRAVSSIDNAKTVIIGGMDRHIHYGILEEFIKAHAEYNYILSYESGSRILEELGGIPDEKAPRSESSIPAGKASESADGTLAGTGNTDGSSDNAPANCYYATDLASSVALAKDITPSGSACILSPAAASYGYFKNFEDRGDTYKKLVMEDNL